MKTTGVNLLRKLIIVKIIAAFALLTLSSPFLFAAKKQSHKISKNPGVHKKISRGETLYSILKKHRFNEAQVRKVLSKAIFPAGHVLSRGEKYRVKAKKDRLEITFYSSKKDISYFFWREGSKKSVAEEKQLEFDTKVIHVKGKVHGSLVGSIQKKLPDQKVAYRFLDAFVYHQNIARKIQKGAHFALSVEKKFEEGSFVRYGEILTAELEFKGKVLKRKYLPFKNGGVFLIPEGNGKDKPLFSPVSYISISSGYLPRRKHPIKKIRRPHWGLDFELPEGEKIFSAQAGRVLRKGRSRGAGNYVVVKHKNGIETYYNHLSRFAKRIKKGYFIKNGEVLGYVGCTGYCTKPHLHFAVKKKGRYLNPIKHMKIYPFRNKKVVQRAFAKLNKSSRPIN